MRYILLLCCVFSIECAARVMTLPVKVKVIDEAGVSVEKVGVDVYFSQNRMQSPSIRRSGLTDTNGVFSVVQSGDGGVNVKVSHEGYYNWFKEFYFYPHAGTREITPFDPNDQPIEVVLKKIDHPIPMYVKEVRLQIPSLEVPIGFDLEKGDWCKPHGTGRKEDLIMTVQKTVHSYFEFEGSLDVKFSNHRDGILGMKTREDAGNDLRLPKHAPTDGYSEMYSKSIVYSSVMKKVEGVGPDNSGNFIFRVRTVTDEDGEVISANYGKIHGGFTVQLRNTETAKIRFQYYYNPDTSRNLEFDPQSNLLIDNKKYDP